MEKIAGVVCLFGAACAGAPAATAAAASPADDVNGAIHAGDWLVRLRAISIQPAARTTETLSALDVGVNNAMVPEFDFTYMIRDDIGVEVILGTSHHQLTSKLGNLGGVGVLPPTLLLQYHFNHAGRIRPYVGAGINYTLFYNNGLHANGQPIAIDNHSRLRSASIVALPCLVRWTHTTTYDQRARDRLSAQRLYAENNCASADQPGCRQSVPYLW